MYFERQEHPLREAPAKYIWFEFWMILTCSRCKAGKDGKSIYMEEMEKIQEEIREKDAKILGKEDPDSKYKYKGKKTNDFQNLRGMNDSAYVYGLGVANYLKFVRFLWKYLAFMSLVAFIQI